MNENEMIIPELNTPEDIAKYTDKVLEKSRAAGATGATILHSRSIGSKQAEQIIGTTLSRETDTIAFLTAYEYKNKIMEAIRDNAGLKTEGGAVIFSLPVDSLIGIGRFDDEEFDS